MSTYSAHATDTILLTGIAGFIGFHLAKKLAGLGQRVIGVDNINDYYDTELKYARLRELGFAGPEIRQSAPGEMHLSAHGDMRFYKTDLKHSAGTSAIFSQEKPTFVVHLAAQAGVRYAQKNPAAYIDSNILAFFNIAENCRLHGVRHLVFASSSSVYGANEKLPYSEHDNTDHPFSLYAATKKASELLAHSYAHVHRLPVTGLRFFTVYGPWGRPDMALFTFTRQILADLPIDVYNHGHMQRDFTYIDDIVAGIERIIWTIPTGDPDWDGTRPDPATSRSPYRIYNIGNNQPVDLLEFIAEIERQLGKNGQKNLLPKDPQDVAATCADIRDLTAAIGFAPHTPISVGIARFLEWYRTYYGLAQ